MENSLMPGNMITEHSYSVLSGSTCPNGKTANGWEQFDEIISTFLVEQKIPGATVAVSKKGVILYQQGYGIGGAGYRVHEDSMFRIASISKPVTAAIVAQLFDKLKISLDTKVFGKTGTWHSYSNLGYLVLGEIVEALSGQSYHRVLQTFLQDLDITGVIVGNRQRSHYKCREVEYFNNREPPVVNSIYPEEGTVLPQYGGMAMESSASYGGLVADAASLLKLIDCMEEAVNQSNTNDYRLQPSSSVETAWNTKTDGEELGPEVVGRHDLHCQQTQQLIMKSFDDKVLRGSERVYKDSCYNRDLERVNKDNCFCQCNSTDVICQPDQKKDSSDRQFNSSGICQTRQVYDSSDRQCCSSDKQFNYSDEQFNSSDRQFNSSDRQFNSSDRQFNSTGICQTSKVYDSCDGQCHSGNVVYQLSQVISSDKKYNSSEPGQNFITGDMKHNSKIVSCEPVQNLDSIDWQLNSNGAIHQSSHTSKTCVDNKCSTCSLKIMARDCSIANSNSNRHVNTLEPMHLLNATCKQLVKPLMTHNLAIDSLSPPDFENGRDWYGLGWDVQDNGKSWGHTGGMDGSCGTLFHHHSGLNWAFLLNSWAMDADLNGVIKCALCSVSDAGMYGRDILSIDIEFGVRIVTKDNSQIICLCVSESALSKVISHVKTDGFFITWISTVSQDFSYAASKLSQGKKMNKLSQQKNTKPGKSEPHNRYMAVFKKDHIIDYFVLFNKTAKELQSLINECKKDNFVINFLDSFVDSEAQLRYTAVFKHDSSANHDNDIIVLLSVAASDYVKSVKSFLSSHYLVVQSVTEVCSQMYVSAILFAKNSHGKLPCLPYIAEHSIVSCADNPGTNTHVNMPDKTANALPARNAEASKVYSDIIVGCSTEFQPLLNDTNRDCSSTLSVLQKSEDMLLKESRELAIFQESNGESVFQGSLEGMVLQETIGETVFQKLGVKTLVQKSKRETGNLASDTNCCETVLVSCSNEHFTRSRTRNKPNCQLKTNKILKCQSLTSKQSKFQSSSKKSKCQTSSLPNSTYWVQITPESFLTELNRQTKQNNSLVYAQFYTSDRKPYVSGCWYPKGGDNCYHRISMSKYGLVPELVEAASENVYLQCLCEYVEEDGVVYYAAIWQAR